MNFNFSNNGLTHDGLKRIAEQYYSPAVSDGSDALQTGGKALARCQLEMWALATRRTRAALGFPAQLAACRTPDAFMGAYADFWRTAFAECADTTHRISELFAPSAIAETPVTERKATAAPKVVPSNPGKRHYNGARSAQADELRHAS